MIERAKEWAVRHHAGQADKLGKPYINHVTDVADRVSDCGATVRIVAWLHDIVEDTPVTLDQIETTFGSEVRNGVEGMTRYQGEDYFTDYLPRLMLNNLARVVKTADVEHNMAKLDALRVVRPEDAERLSEKYNRALAILKAEACSDDHVQE